MRNGQCCLVAAGEVKVEALAHGWRELGQERRVARAGGVRAGDHLAVPSQVVGVEVTERHRFRRDPKGLPTCIDQARHQPDQRTFAVAVISHGGVEAQVQAGTARHVEH